MEIKLSEEEDKLINQASVRTGRSPEELVTNCISAWTNRLKVEIQRFATIQNNVQNKKQVIKPLTKPVKITKPKKSFIDKVSSFFKGV